MACGRDARKVLEKHWDTWITEEDWKWIAEMGINSVRLPVSVTGQMPFNQLLIAPSLTMQIGYYHLYAKDPSVVHGTPFVNMGHIFEGAWPRIIDTINKAANYGIGVLIGARHPTPIYPL